MDAVFVDGIRLDNGYFGRVVSFFCLCFILVLSFLALVVFTMVLYFTLHGTCIYFQVVMVFFLLFMVCGGKIGYLCFHDGGWLVGP